MALDVFHIQTLKGQAYDNSAYLQKTIHAALAGTLDLTQEIKDRQKSQSRRSKSFSAPSRIIIDNSASASSTLIEINAKDRPGLLFDITSIISQENLQISAAKVTTFGSLAVDVFYVKDTYGLKIIHSEKLANIEKSIKNILEKNP